MVTLYVFCVFNNDNDMNISYKWLKEYVDYGTLTAQEVADALTSIGLEVGTVEEVETIRGGLKGLVVGEVVQCDVHPNSDHMHICQVNLGTDELQQIVCGAPNVAQGQKVIVATLGTVLYDGDQSFTIKRSKLRGVESLGMICAEDEIGVGTSHDGIIVLPQDTKVGTPAAEIYGLESDYLIEVDITPNRADACSHYGVARDLYAYLRRNGIPASLTRPDNDAFKVDNHDLEVKVSVENQEACPRYCAVSIKGCEVKESPKWLQDKLNTIGLRPINNVVDVTNYIMMAYGQPLHCFDADMIEGQRIVVKTLPEGTPFVTLDGVEHKLSERDLAICNEKEPMCIAGVFGGKGSGTYDTTKNVVLESAYFHPTWIRKSARRHGLSTDASFRFERGIDPDGQIYALKQAALLIKELAGGEIAMDVVDVESQPALPKFFEVTLNYERVNALIGNEIPKDTIKSICESLEMQVVNETSDTLTVNVPAYRVDVQRECDVVEDVLRIYGYNNVEMPEQVRSTLTVKNDVDKVTKLQRVVSEQLTGAGFNEILNNSLTKEAYYEDKDALVHLINPLSSDLNVLRGSLLFGGLECLAHNVNRKRPNLRFYEFGNCYHFNAEQKAANPDKVLAGYSEEMHLGLWLTGKRVETSWAHADENMSVFELKAHVVNVLSRLGINLEAFVWQNGANKLFSKSLALADRQGRVFVELGIVSKAVAYAAGITQEVYFADIQWTMLMKRLPKQAVSYRELAKFPSVRRDLALLLDNGVTFEEVRQVAFKCDRKLLRSVELFDVYEGKNLPAGKKSYAVNFLLQDDTKTMSDKAIDAIMQKIIGQMKAQLGAELR